jgi:hypothetical protein
LPRRHAILIGYLTAAGTLLAALTPLVIVLLHR